MRPEYQENLKRMTRFNEWEERSRSQLTVQAKLDQFLVLYGLWDFVPENIREKVHAEHVAALCRVQKRLKEAGELRKFNKQLNQENKQREMK
ncbi:hypothetical protein KJ762_01070 [bacterium]|nr:hypothetical protein [bacterium]MBU1064763.1 hypothetical protein [bacterium]MBU1633079.1 hypothetical protein [bacterium]MBU1872985.1 hypothetical protein [bacterium]